MVRRCVDCSAGTKLRCCGDASHLEAASRPGWYGDGRLKMPCGGEELPSKLASDLAARGGGCGMWAD